RALPPAAHSSCRTAAGYPAAAERCAASPLPPSPRQKGASLRKPPAVTHLQIHPTSTDTSNEGERNRHLLLAEKSPCLVSTAASDGRCNTIQCVDSTMLPREKWPVWLSSVKT